MQLKTQESAQELMKGDSVTEEPQYYFGIRCWHPQWMQVAFANAKFFTFILCINGLVEGALVSGKLTETLTIECRAYMCTHPWCLWLAEIRTFIYFNLVANSILNS